jgi:hypothetical protein
MRLQRLRRTLCVAFGRPQINGLSWNDDDSSVTSPTRRLSAGSARSTASGSFGRSLRDDDGGSGGRSDRTPFATIADSPTGSSDSGAVGSDVGHGRRIGSVTALAGSVSETGTLRIQTQEPSGLPEQAPPITAKAGSTQKLSVDGVAAALRSVVLAGPTQGLGGGSEVREVSLRAYLSRKLQEQASTAGRRAEGSTLLPSSLKIDRTSLKGHLVKQGAHHAGLLFCF